jgi:thiamine biosynthesis lipoprotein
LCAQVAVETEGHFTARRGRGLDPTGLVKGWAIERASEFLRVAGSRNHAVNGGGDIQFAGEVAPGEPWTVGISDPTDSQRVLTVITGRDFAVATSGSAERGSHIDNPFTGEPAGGILSATVAGPSLTRVDCYATAAFVMGNAALSWIEHLPGHAAMIVPSDSQPLATRSFARLIAQHSADEPTRPRY